MFTYNYYRMPSTKSTTKNASTKTKTTTKKHDAYTAEELKYILNLLLRAKRSNYVLANN